VLRPAPYGLRTPHAAELKRLDIRGVASLRTELQILVNTHDADSQVRELEKLRERFGHSIRVLESPHPLRRYSCLMHALDFTEKREYIAYALRDIYAGTEFAHWLLKGNRLTLLPKYKVRRGDLVMYFRAGEFQHAGILGRAGRVISKWGTFLLCDHGLLEVPSSYGRAIRYFKRPTYEKAFDEFVAYARIRA
jgi:hypothetical protein